MKNTNILPDKYALEKSYDLKQQNMNFIIQMIFIIIAGIFIGLAFLIKIQLSSDYSGFITAGITIGLVLIYMFLHELTHGIFISLFSKSKSRYSFNFPFLTTGTDAYLNKKSFIIVCLAPSVLWGIVLGISFFLVPNHLMLSFYILLGLNFAGSAGDYLQTIIILKSQKDVLIKDDGSKTNIYNREY